MEPTVIQSSKLRVASLRILGFSFGLICPILYIFTIYPADHIGSFFKAIFALCAVASGAIALSEGRKAWRVLNTPGDWRATVTSRRLVWDVAIPSQNLPMDLALVDVAKAIRLEVSRTNKDSDGEYTEIEDRFELYFVDGSVRTFDRATAGLNPHRVFLALAEQGIPYEFWTQDHTKNSVDTSKIFQRSY